MTRQDILKRRRAVALANLLKRTKGLPASALVDGLRAARREAHRFWDYSKVGEDLRNAAEIAVLRDRLGLPQVIA